MEDTDTRKNVAETVRDIMKHAVVVDCIATADNHFKQPEIAAVPDGKTVQDLTSHFRAAAEYLKPARRKGTAKLDDLASIIAWANRFKGDTSALFAKPDMSHPSLTCIADYHAEGAINPNSETGDPTARHMHHRAEYSFPLSDEWKAWMKVSGHGLEKDVMGEFIEANAKDVMDPTPAVVKLSISDKNQKWENRLIETALQIEGRYGQLAQLLQMSRSFQVYETSDLKVVSNRDSGEGQIQFLNEHKDAEGKPLSIPNLIIIAIPVFRGGAPYRMPVRFRYRKSGASIKFVLTIYNPEKAFEAAFKEAVETAQSETDLPLFMGDPEAKA